MALFESEEEREQWEKEQIKRHEALILEENEYKGKVGVTHSGWSFKDGFRNTDKIKFKSTKFKIFDDKIVIERNKKVIEFSNIKEILQEDKTSDEAIILLKNGEAIAIKPRSPYRFEAFLNILKKSTKDNKINGDNAQSKEKHISNSEDKFDKLIKLGEMHDKGLLTDEEFASLKQELLSGNNDNAPVAPEEDVETLENTCENCGANISPDDAFCSECGTQLN